VGFGIRGRDEARRGLVVQPSDAERRRATPSANRPLSERRGKAERNRRGAVKGVELAAKETTIRTGNGRKERHAALRKKGCCVSGKRCRGGVGRGGCAEGRQDDGVKRSRGSEAVAGTSRSLKRRIHAYGRMRRERERERKTLLRVSERRREHRRERSRPRGECAQKSERRRRGV